MDLWNSGWLEWERERDRLMVKYAPQDDLPYKKQEDVALMLANAYEQHNEQFGSQLELKKLSLQGHHLLALLKEPDKVIAYYVFTVVITTAAIDTAIYKQPRLSGTKYATFGKITSWGLVILIALLSQNHNLLNVMRYVKYKFKGYIENIMKDAYQFVIKHLPIPESLNGLSANDMQILLQFVNEEQQDFKLELMDEKVYQIQLKWQEGYLGLFKELQENFGGLIEDTTKPIMGLAFCVLIKMMFKIDALQGIEIITDLCSRARKQLMITVELPVKEFECNVYSQAMNILFLLGPTLATLHKYNDYERFKDVEIDNWGSVIAILVLKKEVFFTRNFASYLSHNVDWYPQRDTQYVVDQTRQFLNIAKKSFDRKGLTEEDLERFDSFMSINTLFYENNKS